MTKKINRSRSITSFAAVLAALIAPAAGGLAWAGDGGKPVAGGAPAGRPAWCDEYSYPRTTSYTADWFEGNTDQELIDSAKSPEVLGEAVCAVEWDDPAERGKLMAARKRWMEMMGFDERDFVVAAGEAKGYVEDEQDLGTVSGPAAQLAKGHPTLDELGGKASMLVRFDVVHECLVGAYLASDEDRDLLRTILCTRERLDVAPALAEIEASKTLTARSRKDLRHMVKRTAVEAKAAAAWVAGVAKDDPGVAKLVAMADAEVAAWAKPTAARTKLVDALFAMEAAARTNKRSAFAGCDATTLEAWQATVKGRTLPKVDSSQVDTAVQAVLADADGYLAYEALRLCAAATASNPAAGQALVGDGLRRRGPRSATFAAWVNASGEIEFDDRDRSMAKLLGAFGSDWIPTIAGVIASIDDRGGDVELSFKPQMITVDECTSSRTTNRIQRIDGDGTVHYVSECLKWGKAQIDRKPSPILVSKVLAHGLAKGMFVVLGDGVPVVATSGAASAKATWVLGASVR